MKPNYQNAGMLDLVFEGRNQAYGAYVLRRDYNKSLQQAMLVMLSATLLFFSGNYLRSKLVKPDITKSVIVDIFTSDIKTPKTPEPKKQDIKLPPQKTDAKPKAATQDLEKTVVHNDPPAQDSIPATKDLLQTESVATTNTTGPEGGLGSPSGTGTGNSTDPGPPAPPVADDAPTRTPDVMPVFPGGEKALLAYLAKYTEFPSQLRDAGVSGQVISEFTINENGTVSDVHIIRSPASGFDREVTRVLKTLPAFTPGLQNGHPVKVRYVVPMFFKLSD